MQKHTQCDSYCFRRKNGEMTCRFGMPTDLRESTRLEFDTDVNGNFKGVWIEIKSNDPLLNSTAGSMLESW